MAISPHMQRYARQVLLSEIGTAGQVKLCAARVRLPASADARVASVARDYLERAGLDVSGGEAVSMGGTAPMLRGGASLEVRALDAGAVSALAGRVELEEAASALAGAFAAVEAIKNVLGAGTPALLPAGLVLSHEGRA